MLAQFCFLLSGIKIYKVTFIKKHLKQKLVFLTGNSEDVILMEYMRFTGSEYAGGNIYQQECGLSPAQLTSAQKP